MAEQKKLAGYLCTGCGIGERLDVQQLTTIAVREGKLASCKTHPMLCSAEGVKLIRDDIDAGQVTHMMIAGCSRRAKIEAFNFPTVAISRANLREGVIWLRPNTDANRETTQEMANDYIRMAAAEIKFMSVPKSSGQQELNKRILVVGGGVTGMTAALETARAGYPVHLVAEEAQLGGVWNNLYKRVPFRAAAIDVVRNNDADLPRPEDPGIADLTAQINAESLITVHLNARIARTSGAPGRFTADIAIESGSTVTENFGAIIQATDYKPYDASQLPEFGYGKRPDVVTNFELEKLAKEANGAPIKRPSDGKEVSSVAFIQCAGQRSEQPGHLPYCSGFCCTESIKQALYFREQNGADATILFTDMRTPGAAGEDFYRCGQQSMVTFTKGKASAVVQNGAGLKVKFKDLILDEDTELDCDLVVLATGQIPHNGPDPYAQLAVEEAESEEEKAAARLKLENAPPSILNLDYRQGTDLPHLRHGFVDSHFICFPYETRRTGIYAAGPVRRPMDMKQAMEDAVGAAMKAIQAAENAARGAAAHPRVGDLSYPSFRKEGCTQCKRCTVECPFGAINEDEQKYPVFNESRCRRCGTCMGACPVRVISFENYSIDTVGQQIKNVEIPDEFSEKPRILALACENDAYPALDMAAQAARTGNGIELTPFARVIPVRCLGSVSLSWITDALNSGFDGIVLMGCRRDDDYQCHFVRGSAMAAERLSKVGDTLQQLKLETERVAVYEVAITDIHRAPQLINDMATTIEKIGMSPFKF
ncbi:hydrogenase iron-sulfur subunit [Rhodoferax sp. 4810]|uniref:Hydrogenase iron-sulfur subunit n=1 Tax=Thiospirillum jenense TaxID=1653858 RepID=A0A839H5W2_9GAMM|nr:hydrogenase iron-sulfur subunit [Thiospirillum jenense]MBB1073053.1 hydrogenase iron-sulfur subunit [Rhodoferax jenense]MBB1125001.1 hydrogenase iron-sulfur subunit [Thiospirillum jenense]